MLAFASAACVSVTFIASKEAMQHMSPLAFTPIWFGVASLWGLGLYLLRRGPRLPPELKSSLRPIILVGVLNGIANLLLFIAINLGDPTLAAFFSRSETIYSVLLGTWLLGERMHSYQWVGVGVAVAGAGLMTFQAGVIVSLMLLILLVSNFFLALSTWLAKKHIAAVPPLVLSTARTMLMGLMLGVVGLLAGQWSWPGLATWLWIIGGAFFGPFFSYLLFYQSLLYLDLAKGTVIRATQPFFVALYSLALFGTLISGRQLVGGIMMVVGVILMLWEKGRQSSRLGHQDKV